MRPNNSNILIDVASSLLVRDDNHIQFSNTSQLAMHQSPFMTLNAIPLNPRLCSYVSSNISSIYISRPKKCHNLITSSFLQQYRKQRNLLTSIAKIRSHISPIDLDINFDPTKKLYQSSTKKPTIQTLPKMNGLNFGNDQSLSLTNLLYHTIKVEVEEQQA